MPIEYYSPASGGAISTIMMQTAKELINFGHQVTVLTKKSKDECYDIGEVIEIEAPDKTELNFLQRLKCKFFRDIEGWDYPYYGIYKDSFSRALARLKKKPDVIMVFNDLISPLYIRKVFPETKIGVWLQNEQHTRNKRMPKTLAAIHRVLTCSEYIRSWSIETHGISPDKVISAASGVDLTKFFPRQDCFDKAADERVKTVYVGRIDPNKGVDIALNAVRHVSNRGAKPITFTIAGDVWFYASPGDVRNQYRERLLAELDQLPEKSFLGHVPHNRIPEIFREHDVAFVLSRSNEPFGLVSLEAMASGCAVIASNRGGLPEACGDAGTLVDPDKQDEVDAALSKLCNEPDWLLSQKTLSVERAARATWRKTSQIFVDAFTN